MNTTSIFQFLSSQFIYSCIIFILIASFALALRKKHPFVLYTLWMLFFLRLLLPPTINHQWTLRNGIDHLIVEAAPQNNAAGETGIHHEINEAQANSIPLPSPTQSRNWQDYLIYFWGIGVALGLLILLGKRAYFYRLARKGKPANIEIYKILKKWQNRFGFRRKVIIRISEKIPTAFTMGTFNPVIVLPENMPDDTEAMIAHELAHIQRYDDFWVVLHNLISIFYFFHPAVWLASRQIYIARECICDSMVLSHRKIDRSAYGQSLINSLKFAFWNAAGVGTLSFSSKTAMKIRIKNVKETRMLKNKLWIIMLFIVTAVFILPLAGFVGEEEVVKEVETVETIAEPDTVIFQHPLAGSKYRITAPYGWRSHPLTGERKLHPALDLGTARGTDVLASADGIVIKAISEYEPNSGYGKIILIQHANGFRTRYCHLGSIYVTEGHKVKAGEKIAEVGTSGASTAPHLHFELWEDGERINPQRYIKD